MRERRAELAALERPRVRQAVGRGRRRRLRGDRLPRVLRARGRRAGRAARALLPGARRAQRAALRAARRRARSSRRGTSRSRSRRGMVAAALATGNAVDPQARRAGARLRRSRGRRGAARGRRARRTRSRLLPGEGEAGAALVRRPATSQTIAFTGSGAGRPGDPAQRRGDTPDGAAPPQARRRRDGRQELRDRRRRRRPRRRGARDRARAPSSTPARSARPPSRVLVHEAIADALLERAGGRRRRARRSARPTTFGTDVPPVIEREAQERVAALRASAPRATGAIVARSAPAPGRRAGSARRRVVADLPADSPVLREEIFGPLLTVERVRDVDARRATASTSCPSRSPAGCSRRNPRTVERVVRRIAGRQPLRQPLDHRRDGRPPAVRRQPPVGHRHEGRRAGLPPAVRRAAAS